MTVETYTDEQATDEALLLLIRKLRRLHPAAYADLMSMIPEGAQRALNIAEMRADTQRAYDTRDGIKRDYSPDNWVAEVEAADAADLAEIDT